jgi:hypothetical protein
VERSYYAVAVSFQKRLLEVMFDDERWAPLITTYSSTILLLFIIIFFVSSTFNWFAVCFVVRQWPFSIFSAIKPGREEGSQSSWRTKRNAV